MGPVNPYLAAVGAAFDPTALAGQSLGFGPPQSVPQQVMLGAPGGMPAPLPTPPPAPAGPPPPGPDPTLDPVGMVSRAPPGPSSSQAPPPAPAPPPHAPPPQAPEGPQYGLVPVGGGGVQTIAAHETEMRGPSLLRAQGARNQAVEDTVGRVADRSADLAAAEYGMALDQERGARAREQAAAQSLAERDEEMAQRQQDFDQSVKALSKMSVDPDRFWASRSTGQKISGLIGIALGGLGGSNAGMNIINQAIERDIKAQEFAYGAARDTANAKQTAFGMAMQKYGQIDAARSMARAAALDAVIAQTQQMAALSKGTEAQNRADMALAALMDEKAQQVAQGVLFAPARQVAAPRMFVDPTTGLTYTEQQAREVAKEYRGYGFEQGKLQSGFLADVGKELVKGQIEGGKKADDGARAISSQLQQAGVPQARAAAELALQALNKSEGGFLEGTMRGYAPGATKLVASQDANAREQAYANFSNAAIKAMMGNATEAEVARAEGALGNAKDPAARRRAIAMTLETLSSIEKNAKAGASPAAQAEFDARRQAAEGGPAAAPKGSKAGW